MPDRGHCQIPLSLDRNELWHFLHGQHQSGVLYAVLEMHKHFPAGRIQSRYTSKACQAIIKDCLTCISIGWSLQANQSYGTTLVMELLYMKKFRALTILVLIIGTVHFSFQPVLAFPSLPSSFYSNVKVDAANVPDGTLVKASINGQVYAEAKTLTYQGDSVYSLDVLGDDSSTTTVEGGHDGDTIVFTIGGKTASQNGTWKGGTITNLNLLIFDI